MIKIIKGRILNDIAKEMLSDYMTSEQHHPGYVLVPTSAFNKLRAAERGLPWHVAPWGDGSKPPYVNICSDSYGVVVAADLEREIANFIVELANATATVPEGEEQGSARSGEEPPSSPSRERVEVLEEALRFYARGCDATDDIGAAARGDIDMARACENFNEDGGDRARAALKAPSDGPRERPKRGLELIREIDRRCPVSTDVED